jgi:hypothetical protein
VIHGSCLRGGARGGIAPHSNYSSSVKMRPIQPIQPGRQNLMKKVTKRAKLLQSENPPQNTSGERLSAATRSHPVADLRFPG